MSKTEKEILEKKFLLVQSLTEETFGVKQKYNRIGSRKFVPYKFSEITILKIKEACESYFEHDPDKVCDILATEQGPSYMYLSQIPKLSLIHIRFVDRTDDYACASAFNGSLINKINTSTRKAAIMPSGFSRPSVPVIARPLKKESGVTDIEASSPAKLTATKMLDIGCLIYTHVTYMYLSTFDIKTMAWSVETPVEFVISQDPFADGSFRNCFRAQSQTGIFKNKTWVVKEYKEATLQYFEETKVESYNPETQCKKTVQMHQLAKNFADVLALKAGEPFGPVFKYKELFYGKVTGLTIVKHYTVEEFVDGDFRKYINNTGVLLPQEDENMHFQNKAECLSHFSYEYSKTKLLLTDVQGINWTLIDPEIASTMENYPTQNERLFVAGNLTTAAIKMFFSHHKCNIYCELMELKEVSIDKKDAV